MLGQMQHNERFKINNSSQVTGKTFQNLNVEGMNGVILSIIVTNTDYTIYLGVVWLRQK